MYYTRYLLLAKNNRADKIDHLGGYADTNTPSDIPQSYFEVNQKIEIEQDADGLDKGMAIARYLRKNVKGGRGLGYASDKTLQMMLEGNGGVCSDFSQIFNNFCLINGVRVKEWGCIDRFFDARFAHTFNEVYSEKYGKWVAMDVQHCFCFVAEGDNVPLSGIEVFKRSREGKSNTFYFFEPDYRPHSTERLKNIYNAKAIPFLIINYRNREIDSYFNRFRGKFPVFVVSAMLILLRKNFHFLFVMDNYKIKLLPKYFQDLATK